MDENEVKAAADRLKAEAKTTAETAGKAAAEVAVAEVKGELTGVKSGIEEIKAAQAKHQEDIDKLALDMARGGGKGGEPGLEGKSIHQEYAESVMPKFKEALANGKSAQVDLSAKAAVTMLTAATVPGRLVQPTQGMYVGLPNAVQHVRDLLAPGTMSSNLLVYPREVAAGIQGGPAITAEGAKKPQMSFTYEEKTTAVKKIPVYFKVSTELVADAPAFVSYMQARAAESIKDVEDQELLYGDGTSAHLDGIFPLATAFDAAGLKITNPQRIDVLRLAVAQVRRAKYAATAIMLSPDDCASLELTKDTQGRYMLPTILTGLMPMIGRVQIVEVDAINDGDFLVGAFDRGAQVFSREGLTIRMFDQNEDDAVKNLVTVVLEERLLQAVYRPASFVKGTFATAITSIT